MVVAGLPGFAGQSAFHRSRRLTQQHHSFVSGKSILHLSHMRFHLSNGLYFPFTLGGSGISLLAMVLLHCASPLSRSWHCSAKSGQWTLSFPFHLPQLLLFDANEIIPPLDLSKFYSWSLLFSAAAGETVVGLSGDRPVSDNYHTHSTKLPNHPTPAAATTNRKLPAHTIQ